MAMMHALMGWPCAEIMRITRSLSQAVRLVALLGQRQTSVGLKNIQAIPVSNFLAGIGGPHENILNQSVP